MSPASLIEAIVDAFDAIGIYHNHLQESTDAFMLRALNEISGTTLSDRHTPPLEVIRLLANTVQDESVFDRTDPLTEMLSAILAGLKARAPPRPM